MFCHLHPSPTPSRKEEALRKLPEASKLITNIALGQPLTLPSQSPRRPPLHRGKLGLATLVDLVDLVTLADLCSPALLLRDAPSAGVYSRFLEQKAFDIPQYRHKLNPSQNTAVREALRKQFTVIQGPPGGPHLGELLASHGLAGKMVVAGTGHRATCPHRPFPQARGRPWWPFTSSSGSTSVMIRFWTAVNVGGQAPTYCTVALPTSRWMYWQVCNPAAWGGGFPGFLMT